MSAAVYEEMLTRISKVYEGYQRKAEQQNEQARLRLSDKSQRAFVEKVAGFQPAVAKLLESMRTNKPFVQAHRDAITMIEGLLTDLREVLSRKAVQFRVGDDMTQLLDDSINCTSLLQRGVEQFKPAGGLCCFGGNGDPSERIRQPLVNMRINAARWRLLNRLEPKGTSERFTCPKFQESDFTFIREILQRRWPGERVVEKLVEKEVVRTVTLPGAKADGLAIANQFLFGINRQINVAYALKLYTNEAQNGNGTAASFLGTVHENAEFVTQDLQRAIDYYGQAVAAGEPYAKYRMAMGLISGRFSKGGRNRDDIRKGFEMLQKIVEGERQSAEALAQLGQIYEYGHFCEDDAKLFQIPIDLRKALDYYRRAESMQLLRALNNLGVFYFKHRDFQESIGKREVNPNDLATTNVSRAVEYLLKAQKAGHIQAFYNLGVLHSTPGHPETRPDLAATYFYQGALRGDDACRVMFTSQLITHASVVKEDFDAQFRTAWKWLSVISGKQSTSSGISTLGPSQSIQTQALYLQGLMLEHGIGTDKQPVKALQLYLQAADGEHPNAYNKVGDCYFSGIGTREDKATALAYYWKATELGCAESMANLGAMYLNGFGEIAPRNYGKAFDLFGKAIDAGNTSAMVHLSEMYRRGLGLESDEVTARSILVQAAECGNQTAVQMLRVRGLGQLIPQNLDETEPFGFEPSQFNLDLERPLLVSLVR